MESDGPPNGKPENQSEEEEEQETKPDIHPEATFGDVEGCPSLPVVTEVTSLANLPDETEEAEENMETAHETDEIEDMLIPTSDKDFPEEHDVISATGLMPKEKTPEKPAAESEGEGSMDSCQFCHILIPASMLEDHLRIHQQLDEPLTCPKSKCTNEFLTAFDLKNHLLSIHPGGSNTDLIPTVYRCDSCSKECRSLPACQTHVKHRHPNRRVTITKELILTRTKAGEFVCPICVKSYQTRKTIVRHFNDIHQLGVKAETIITMGMDNPDMPEDEHMDETSSQGSASNRRESARLSARAQTQQREYDIQAPMLRGALGTLPGSFPQLATGQSGISGPGGTDEEPIVCPSCNEVYYDMAAFKRHYYRHTVRYTCRVCNRKITGMNEYKEHCSQHINRPRAPGEVKRTCPYCGKSFIDMKVHLRKHESACDVCGLQFVHLNNMNRHYLDVHGIDLNQFSRMPDGPEGRKMNTSLGEKLDGYHKTLESIERFEANVPQESFQVKTEQMDVTCEYCALTYPSQELYNRHVVTHNQKCKLCQVLIDHEQNIRPHLKTAHGINDVDNIASLFEQTIVANITEPMPMMPIMPFEPMMRTAAATTPVSRPAPPKRDSRESLESEGPSKKAKRDSLGRAECKICYRKVIDLPSHMTTHNIKCSLCDWVSIHRFNLRPHMRQAHGLNDDEIDALIEDIIANPVQVWDVPTNNAVHNRPGATTLPSVPKTPESSVSPANSSPVPFGRQNCKLCSKQFSRDNMKRHLQSAHNVKCGRCGKFFVHQASIYGHMKALHGLLDYDQIRRETISCYESDDEDISSTASPAMDESEPELPPEPVRRVEPKAPPPKPKMKSPSPSPVPVQKPSTSGGKAKKCKVCKQIVDDIKTHNTTHYRPCPLCEVQFHPQGFRAHLKQKHGITDPDAIKSMEEDSDEDEDEDDDASGFKEEPEERDQTPEPESPSPAPSKPPPPLQNRGPGPNNTASPHTGSVICQYCNKKTRDLPLHLSTRHNLKCLICSSVIKHYSNVKVHMRSMHQIEDANVAEMTESMYLLENPPQLPEDPHGPLEVSNSVLDLSYEEKPDDGRIQCDFCETSLKNHKYYAAHCKNVHKIKLPSKRRRAGDSRDDSEDDGKDFFHCTLCGSQFTNRQHLVLHLKHEHGGIPMASPGVARLDGRSSLESPMEDDTSSDTGTYPSDSGQKLPEKTFKIYCDKCFRGFTQRRYLWHHFKTIHGEYEAYARYTREGKLEGVAPDTPGERKSIEGPAQKKPKVSSNSDQEEEFIGAEDTLLKGVTDKSEIIRRKRLIAKHKFAMTVTGGLGFGAHPCQHCNRRFATPSSLYRHIRHDSCPVLLLKKQKGGKKFQEKFADDLLMNPLSASASGQSLLSSALGATQPKPKPQSSPMAQKPSTSMDPHAALMLPSTPVATSTPEVSPLQRMHENATDFRCSVCKIYLSSPISLKRHLLTHTGEKPIRCFFCFKGFNQNVHLRAHLARYHEIPMEHTRNVGIDNEAMQVQLMGKFNPAGLKKRGTSSADEMKCMICEQTFSDKIKLRDHMSIHGSSMPYPCTICHRGYEAEHGLKSHLLRVHSLAPAKADQIIAGRSQLLQLNAGGDDPRKLAQLEPDAPESDIDDDLPETKPDINCKNCRGQIRSIDENIAHARYHKGTGHKNYCYVCWQSFSHVRSLTRHFLTIHVMLYNSSDPNPKRCRICDVDVVNVPRHYKTCHEGITPDQKDCKCHLCGTKFFSVIHRKVHYLARHKEHGKKIFPKIIKKPFFPRKETEGKIAKTFIEEKPVSSAKFSPRGKTKKNWCKICRKIYINPAAHMKAHTGVPTFDCNQCGRIYSSSGAMIKHKRTCREVYNDYDSPASTSTIVTSPMDSLSNAPSSYAFEHEEDPSSFIEEGVDEQPFETPPKNSLPLPGPVTESDEPVFQTPMSKSGGYCPVCPCTIPIKLNRHIKTVHKRGAMPKFRCTACNRLFLKKETKVNHMYTEHRINILTDSDEQKETAPPSTPPPDEVIINDDVKMMDVRVMLQRMGRRETSVPEVKEEPEDWTLGPDADDVNSEATDRRPGSAARPSSRDGRPSIFEVIIPNEKKSPSHAAEPRYVKCSACDTYLQTKKTDEQLVQFRLLCNSCLNIDTTKIARKGDGDADADTTSDSAQDAAVRSSPMTARKSTNPMKHAQAAAKPKSKPKPSPFVASTFVPKAKAKKKATAQCEKCGMRFVNRSAASSHARLIHAGPYRLKDGVQLTNSSKCEFCGATGLSTKKTAHLRRYHPDLFEGNSFSGGMIEKEEVDLNVNASDIGGQALLEESMDDGIEPEEPSYVGSEDLSVETERSEEPPELEYEGGPQVADITGPGEDAPPIMEDAPADPVNEVPEFSEQNEKNGGSVVEPSDVISDDFSASEDAPDESENIAEAQSENNVNVNSENVVEEAGDNADLDGEPLEQIDQEAETEKELATVSDMNGEPEQPELEMDTEPEVALKAKPVPEAYNGPEAEFEEDDPDAFDDEPPSDDELSDSDDESDAEGAEICTDCGKTFSNARCLTVHARLHSGETPYKCEFCAEQFYCKRILSGHTADFH